MLQKLVVTNIALMDALTINFHEGFSALTGETGAGKSILIEAVGFVLGERASRESIRTGEQKASAEGWFRIKEDSPAAAFLKERELYEGEETVLYRELNQSGRNVCRINGTLVTAGEMKKLGELLVDMHGQHAHQSLLDADTHLGLLDAFAGDAEQLQSMRSQRETALAAREKRQKLQRAMGERARRLGVIDYELKEINGAALTDGEEEALFQQRRKLQNFAQVQENLQGAYDALYGESGALGSVSEASRCLNALKEYGAEYEASAQQTEGAYYALEDVSYTLRDALRELAYDPGALEEIEGRLFLIEELKRKYGVSIAEILRYRDGLEKEKQALLGGEETLAELEKQEKEAVDAFRREALALSACRREAAQRLKTVIEKNLQDMGMAHASFTAGFTAVPCEELGENGVDAMEFLFSANRGEGEKPLVKVASGGEISRIMLAFKAALLEADAIDTLIFDEIDTGISGLIAHTVAKKMRQLSRSHQVLCVTHLAQIAAYADRQYFIHKETLGDKTVSRARELTEEERPAELARIMGSVHDEAALEHARGLLKTAREEE